MKPKIAICIPHWGAISLEWAHDMYAQALTKEDDFEKMVKTCQGILNLDTERNVLVQHALKDPLVTHILFIDSDCVLEEYNLNDAIRILLSTELPIVSGLYRTKVDPKYPYAMWRKEKDGYINIETWTGGNLVTVDVVGFGFVFIKREVFDKIPAPWFVWNKAELSEDWCACQKFIENGFSIKVLTDLKLAHIGTFKLMTNGQLLTLKI